jgi:two-component system, NarL family, invasion response regulator UvrY
VPGPASQLGVPQFGARVNPIAAPLTAGHHCRMAPTLFIVDDSPQFRETAATLLAERGFDVLTAAADARQALDAAAGVCPDGMLIDINLPGRDGFAVAAALAAACPGARIVLTSADVAYVPPELLQACTAVAFVRKEELVGADLGALFTPAGT